MADSNFRGPVNAMGATIDQAFGTTTVTVANQANPVVANVGPLDGPSQFYQGSGWVDPRAIPFAKDNYRAGQQPAILNITDAYSVDGFPQAAGTALVAALQTTALATMALATVQQQSLIAGQAFIACGVPIIPAGTTSIATVMAVDFGFTTGTTTTNSSTVVVYDSTQLYQGQWIIIGGAGNATGTQSLITQVTSITSTNITGVTVNPVPATGITNAPIGQANLFGDNIVALGTQYGPNTATPTAHSNRMTGGLGRWMNPRELLARNITVWAGTTSATAAYTITGYDVWGNLMTEKLTVPSLANRGAAGSTIFGAKAFKYLVSAAVQTTASGSTAIGLGDVFGMPFRADDFSQVDIFWNGSNVPYNKSNTFISAYTTAPSTNTTGDVRGTIQVSTNGTGTAAPVQTTAVTNGTARLTIIQNLGVWNTLFANPNNIVPSFGIAQSTV